MNYCVLVIRNRADSLASLTEMFSGKGFNLNMGKCRNTAIEFHNWFIITVQKSLLLSPICVNSSRPVLSVQRTDYLLRDCGHPEMKRSFPDLDYALKGYNILKGYPLATGHDPGYTMPVFAADYSNNDVTSDCRYSIPRGLVITPDVACDLSFSSKVVQTTSTLSKTLEAKASASGGGWGVSFSASAGYKEASSSMSSGEFSYIMSSAFCKYYYSQLIRIQPPPFHRLSSHGLSDSMRSHTTQPCIFNSLIRTVHM